MAWRGVVAQLCFNHFWFVCLFYLRFLALLQHTHTRFKYTVTLLRFFSLFLSLRRRIEQPSNGAASSYRCRQEEATDEKEVQVKTFLEKRERKKREGEVTVTRPHPYWCRKEDESIRARHKRRKSLNTKPKQSKAEQKPKQRNTSEQHFRTRGARGSSRQERERERTGKGKV